MGPKVVITTFKSFRNKNSKKKKIFGIRMSLEFCQCLQNENRRHTGKVIVKNVAYHLFHPVWMCLADLFRKSDVYTVIRIVLILPLSSFQGWLMWSTVLQWDERHGNRWWTRQEGETTWWWMPLLGLLILTWLLTNFWFVDSLVTKALYACFLRSGEVLQKISQKKVTWHHPCRN